MTVADVSSMEVNQHYSITYERFHLLKTKKLNNEQQLSSLSIDNYYKYV